MNELLWVRSRFYSENDCWVEPQPFNILKLRFFMEVLIFWGELFRAGNYSCMENRSSPRLTRASLAPPGSPLGSRESQNEHRLGSGGKAWPSFLANHLRGEHPTGPWAGGRGGWQSRGHGLILRAALFAEPRSPSWFFPATYHVPGRRGARGGSAAGGVPWGCCPESAPSSAGREESLQGNICLN